MKTQEEIEQLAEQIANKHSKQNGEIIGNPRAIMLGTEAIQAVKDGYTQCQEDMADKKYTEEDMLKAFEKGALYGSTKNGNTHYFDEVINSLNKQD